MRKRLAGKEFADGGGDLLDVGFQGEAAGVDEADVGVGEVALEGFGPGGQEERVVLPHTASRGGLLVRKYSWKAG
jgi:hypothetical protein